MALETSSIDAEDIVRPETSKEEMCALEVEVGPAFCKLDYVRYASTDKRAQLMRAELRRRGIEWQWNGKSGRVDLSTVEENNHISSKDFKKQEQEKLPKENPVKTVEELLDEIAVNVFSIAERKPGKQNRAFELGAALEAETKAVATPAGKVLPAAVASIRTKITQIEILITKEEKAEKDEGHKGKKEKPKKSKGNNSQSSRFATRRENDDEEYERMFR